MEAPADRLEPPDREDPVLGQLFGTDGVRGRANQYPITPEIALQLGKAIAHTFRAEGRGSKRAVIGKDTRLSGYMLETALTSGMVSMGMDVYLVGPMPTPAVAHLTKSMGAAVGLMITASHNPADDNGIKIFNHDGYKLRDALEEQIEKQVLEGEITSQHIPFDQIGKAHRIEDARGRYIEFAKSAVNSAELDGLKVVVDCANGAAYFLGPLIFRELGAQVTKLGCDPDGYNINLDCGAMAPARLQQVVMETGADVGIALDGDADRVVFCDRDGRMVDGDRIIGLCAMDLARRGRLRQNTVVTTVMSNIGLYQAMARSGIAVETTPVGDRYVIEALRDKGWNFGGENSGHLIFRDYATTGDGIISALQVLRLLRESGQSLGELSREIDIFPSQLVNLKVNAKPDLSTLPALQDALAACSAALGDTGRQLVRYSGTENKIRIYVEARDAATVQDWVTKLSTVVTKELC